MTLVKRLRAAAADRGVSDLELPGILWEAADEIERLNSLMGDGFRGLVAKAEMHATNHFKASEEIDALKADLTTVKRQEAQALATVEAFGLEISSLKATLAEAQKENLEISDDYAEMAARAEKAEAEAAALREALQMFEAYGHATKERVKKLEAVAEAAKSFSDTWEMRDSSYTPLAKALAALPLHRKPSKGSQG